MSNFGLPHGCLPRGTIEEAFRCPYDRKHLEEARNEYKDLLKNEQIVDMDTRRQINRSIAVKTISSYTEYGEELHKCYPESELLRLIRTAYKTYREEVFQTAMKEFEKLQQANNAAIAAKHKDAKAFRQTYAGHSKGKPVVNEQSRDFNRTIQPAIPVAGVHSSKNRTVVPDDQPVQFEGRTYYPEGMYMHVQNLVQVQGQDVTKLQKELKDKEKEVDELRNRLSTFASKQLVDGNPNFTDLGDKNRPTNIAERFHHIYDDEWTSSLESLTRAPKGTASLSEEEAITLLMNIIKNIYHFCSNYTEKQLKILNSSWNLTLEDPFASAHGIDSPSHKNTSTISEAVFSAFKQNRKQENKDCIKNAIKNFRENVLLKNSKIDGKLLSAMEPFVDKCVEVIWIMCIQDPPMYLQWPEPGDKFNSEHYKEYFQKGTTVKLAVWPVVFLNKGGALIDKGFAMPMKQK